MRMWVNEGTLSWVLVYTPLMWNVHICEIQIMKHESTYMYNTEEILFSWEITKHTKYIPGASFNRSGTSVLTNLGRNHPCIKES